MTAAEAPRTDERATCGDRWNEMTCTLPAGHTGMHIDERVFGSVESPADRLAAAVTRAEAAEAKVAAVDGLVRNWARLAGQACDPDTREWLTATVTSLHTALGSATTEEADRG